MEAKGKGKGKGKGGKGKGEWNNVAQRQWGQYNPGFVRTQWNNWRPGNSHNPWLKGQGKGDTNAVSFTANNLTFPPLAIVNAQCNEYGEMYMPAQTNCGWQAISQVRRSM